MTRLDGKGKVIQQGKELAEVYYWISIQEQIKKADSISGRVEVISGERNLPLGQIMILILDDGRHWEFFARKGNPVSAIYECSNVNPNGII